MIRRGPRRARWRATAGQTTTEFLMIAGLATTSFLVINRWAFTPVHLMLQNVLQCIADGTINQMACDGGGSAGGAGGSAAPNPFQSLLQRGSGASTGFTETPGPLTSAGGEMSFGLETGMGGAGSGGGSGSGSDVGPSSAPANFAIARTTGSPVPSSGYKSSLGASGAYYRKVESQANRTTTGIRAVMTLPTFTSDPTRQNNDPTLGKTGPMDRPSMYMGAHAEATIDKTHVSAEADIGLQYTQRYDAQGRPTYVLRQVQDAGTRPSDAQLYYLGDDGEYYNQNGERFTGNKADMVEHYTYTPFARLNEPVMVNGKPQIGRDGKVVYDNRYVPLSPKEDQSRYFYPGERVEMSVSRTTGPDGAVTFSVQRDGSAPQIYTLDSVVLVRPDADVSVKRVTSIDQYVWLDGQVQSAEKRAPPTVDPTKASLSGAVWERVTVLGGEDQFMTGGTFTEVVPKDPGNRVNEAQTFTIGSPTSKGGERITITPTPTR
ncbi:MAG: hypothetical protein U0Q12_15190 [Vicinamibacterales bacterium]